MAFNSSSVLIISAIPPRIILTELADLSTAYGALRRGIEKVDRLALTVMLGESA